VTWREDARPIIAEVIARVGTSDMKALRRALREAFPWGDVSWPRKIWRDEVKVQLGTKKKTRRGKRKSRRSDEDQPTLF
jgi:hypothetical protein